jgi:hypothetical protein
MKTSEINDELGIAAQLDEVVDRKTADDLAAIAELARIPRYRRDEFCLAVVNLILVLWEDWVLYRYQSPHSNQISRLQEAELAVRAARDAVRALGAPMRGLVACTIRSLDADMDEHDFARVIAITAAALARMVGVNPERHTAGRRGRPKGGVASWPFYKLVLSLWQLVNDFEGHFTLTTKDGVVKSGTLATALGLLRRQPGFDDLIPARLPAKVLETIKRNVLSTPPKPL